MGYRLDAEGLQVAPALRQQGSRFTRLHNGDRPRHHRDDIAVQVKDDGFPAVSCGLFRQGEADQRRGGIHADHPDRGFRLGMLPVHRTTVGQDKAD